MSYRRELPQLCPFISARFHPPDHREKVTVIKPATPTSVPCCQLTHSVCSVLTVQDGYTLERVDIYGLIDGVHETVVIPGAECYVGRKDNPSFSPYGLLLYPL